MTLTTTMLVRVQDVDCLFISGERLRKEGGMATISTKETRESKVNFNNIIDYHKGELDDLVNKLCDKICELEDEIDELKKQIPFDN